MAASKEGLIDNINCKLTTGGLTDIQASQLAGAAQALCCSSFYAVPCAACLPNAALNKGRFVYVQNAGNYRYSDGTNWTNEFCSAKIAGNLFTWGSNGISGQLGYGTTTSPGRFCPGTVAGGGSTWCAIARLGTAAGAIKTDGTLWTWGSGGSNQLGDGTSNARSSPGTTAGGGTNWCLVSFGTRHSMGIKTDGTLWTWGYNGQGQLGDGTTISRTSPGTVAGGGTTWCFVDGSANFTVAVKTDGTLWTWGYNTFGQLGTGNTTSRSSPGTVAGGGTTWRIASAGIGFTGAIKTDGTLWTWGYNGQGKLGDGTVTSRTSPGTVAGGGSTWCAISLGCQSSFAIKTDGTLWTWGGNGNGQLGTGNTTSRSSPGTTAGGGTNWCYVSTSIWLGGHSSLGVKTDGTLWTWGLNGYGQLGTGDTTNRSSPGTTIASGTRWTKAVIDQGTIGLQTPVGF